MLLTRPASSSAPLLSHAAERAPERLTLGLWLIVLFKGVTALLLWTTFGLLMAAHRANPQDFVSHLVRGLFHGEEPGIAIRLVAENTRFITPQMIGRVAIATAAYALVESLEASGLLLHKPWAEWLVILVTISFIPFELFEIVRQPTIWKMATLAANLLILWYLLIRVLTKQRKRRMLAN